MKKWGGLLLSLIIITLLLLIPTALYIFTPVKDEKVNIEKTRIVLTQGTETEGKGDTYFIAFLKQMSEKLETWLKSLNEKIEREDITRFKVRFYEFLRNILESVKEKIDAKIESSEGQRPQKKDKEGLFRETRQRIFPIFETG